MHIQDMESFPVGVLANRSQLTVNTLKTVILEAHKAAWILSWLWRYHTQSLFYVIYSVILQIIGAFICFTQFIHMIVYLDTYGFRTHPMALFLQLVLMRLLGGFPSLSQKLRGTYTLRKKLVRGLNCIPDSRGVFLTVTHCTSLEKV